MRKLILASCVALAALTACKEIDPDASRAARVGAGEEAVTVGPLMDESPAQKAYGEANARMHAGMGTIDRDPDIAFMQGMVPHHQGAVDMAHIVLEHGKDPEARALAESIIESQEREIAQMNAWLERRGITPGEALEAMVDHEAMGH